MPILRSMNGETSLSLNDDTNTNNKLKHNTIGSTDRTDDDIYVNMGFKPVEEREAELEALRNELRVVKSELAQVKTSLQEMSVCMAQSERSHQHEVKSLKKKLTALATAVATSAVRKAHDDSNNYYSTDVEDDESTSVSRSHFRQNSEHIVHF